MHTRLISTPLKVLLSSHRSYAADRDWSWLRFDQASSSSETRSWIRFEPATDAGSDAEALHELVVGADWPCKVVSNRPDGSYATGDLYTEHPERPGLWKVVARADDTIVLTNGKKLLASHVEALLQRQKSIQHALVFGQNRPLIGALVFPAPGQEQQTVESELRTALEQIGGAMPPHARLSREMVQIMPESATAQVPKSSKGTVQRVRAYRLFSEEVDGLYARFEGAATQADTQGKLRLAEDELVAWISERVAECRADRKAPPPDADLFSAGIDSTASLRIRAAMQRTLDLGSQQLSKNVVYEHSSIADLAKHCIRLREGKSSSDRAAATLQRMKALSSELAGRLERTTDTSGATAPTRPSVILTGATGSLGGHILRQLISRRSQLSCVIVLLRASSDSEALKRLNASLQAKQLPPLAADEMELIRCHAVNLADAQDIARLQLPTLENSIYIHAAWEVNFALGLPSFAGCLHGVVNLLNAHLATRRSRFVFCSTIATCLGPAKRGEVQERPHDDPSSAAQIGYAQSKWVAEQVCATAGRHARDGRSVAIARIGQLCGDRQHGAWNTREAWPQLIKTAEATGQLPRLEQDLDWLPVDMAAQAIIDVAMQEASQRESETTQYFHVVEPHAQRGEASEWDDLLRWLEGAGLSFKLVDHATWLDSCASLKASSDSEATRGSITSLLDTWSNLRPAQEHSKSNRDSATPISVEKASEASPALRSSSTSVNAEHIRRTVQYWRGCGFLSS